MKNLYACVMVLICTISTSFSQISSTVTGGNWSDPGTWVGGVVPTATDAVIIADNAVVIIDTDATILSLTVGNGVTGLLEYEETNPRTLTVSTDVTISTGAIFRSSTNGSQTGHQLTLGGNLINDGSLNFSSNGNTAAAGITFTGAGNATFSGAGANTDVYRITVNKGSSSASILELTTSNFTYQGSSTTAGFVQSFLTLLNGTFKVSGTFTMDNGLFTGTGDYTVPPTAGLWLNNPNFTVNARAGTANIEGFLQMDAGTLNVGIATNNRLGYIDGAVININGGAVNVASRFSATTTFGLSYTQTGGIFTVNTVGSTSGTRASFDIRDEDNSTFNMSGGTIVLQNPGTSGSGPRDYYNDATNINITGGTLQVGNALTALSQTFFLAGDAPALTLFEPATPTARLFADLGVNGNTSIPVGSSLILSDGTISRSFFQRGSTTTNSGTIDATAIGSIFAFTGTTAQTYAGDGNITSPIASLTFANSAGVTFTNSIAIDVVASILTMTAGDVSTGVTTLTLGTSPANSGTFNYSSGTIIGRFKRWLDAAAVSLNFPVGIAGSTRTATIDFTTAPAAGGTLTAEWVSADPGTNGLPLTEPGYPTINNTAPDGFWTIVAGDGLSGGVYTGVFVATNVVSVIDFTQLVLLKRADNTAPWTLDGTHVPTTGSNTTPILSRTGMTGFSDFAIGGSPTSLPLKVESFRGTKQGKDHLLTWKISCTNSPSATISLERSADARVFRSIYQLTATAVRCLQPFLYTDETPVAGVNYYRLQLKDADGNVSYSNIISLLNKETGFEIVSMMPNPVQQLTVLNVASAVAGKIAFVITDASGKRIYSNSETVTAGNNQVTLDLSKLAAGTYQITGYQSNSITRTLRFVKL